MRKRPPRPAEETEWTCPICLQPEVEGLLSCCLQGCVAGFHGDCAERALQAEARCPVCRRDVQRALLPPLDAFLALRGECCRRYAALECSFTLLARLLRLRRIAARSSARQRRRCESELAAGPSALALLLALRCCRRRRA